MRGQLERLVKGGAAYQAASLLAAAFAVLTLPLYTDALSTEDYGYAETLLTFIILTSILLRGGIGEAFVRFWFDDDDDARRQKLLRAAWLWVLVATTLAALVGLALAGPLSELLLDTRDTTLMAYGLLGLWAFANLEIAYAILRVEERRTTYLVASCANVLLTVALTVTLVLGLDLGARGYVLGNYGASTVVLVALWWMHRDRLGWEREAPLRALLRFGAPTVPAASAVFALNVIDRAYLLRVESPGAAGVYAVAVKLATAVIVITRGFQAAWPPLAYSVTDDEEAGRLYARVTTLYVALAGLVVAGITLLGRPYVQLLTAEDFEGAYEALPWVALGWALYGLNLVLVTVAGRAKVTTRNFPAAAAGLVVNVVVLVLLVPSMGTAAAGVALCAAYVVMLVVLHGLTRRLFAVPFEWGRLAAVVGTLCAGTLGGELLLDPDADVVRAAVLAVTVLTVAQVSGARHLVKASRSS